MDEKQLKEDMKLLAEMVQKVAERHGGIYIEVSHLEGWSWSDCTVDLGTIRMTEYSNDWEGGIV